MSRIRDAVPAAWSCVPCDTTNAAGQRWCPTCGAPAPGTTRSDPPPIRRRLAIATVVIVAVLSVAAVLAWRASKPGPPSPAEETADRYLAAAHAERYHEAYLLLDRELAAMDSEADYEVVQRRRSGVLAIRHPPNGHGNRGTVVHYDVANDPKGLDVELVLDDGHWRVTLTEGGLEVRGALTGLRQ